MQEHLGAAHPSPPFRFVLRKPNPERNEGCALLFRPRRYPRLGQERREFDASFKVDAVKLVQTGERPIRLIAKELDITETSLRAWVRQAEIDAEAAQNGPLTSAEREELKALRARVKKLEVQQIILKKAAAFFAQDGK